MRKLLTWFCPLAILFLFFIQGWFCIAANSQTFDEAVHLTAGYSYLATGDFRLNNEHPPLVKLLCALPVYICYHVPFDPDPAQWQKALEREDAQQWILAPDFLYQSPVPARDLLATGRIPNLVLGTMLVGLIGWWAYRLWGYWAALLSMSLAAFEPNLIANSALITMDTGISLFMLLTYYLLWEYTQQPTTVRLVAVGLALGLAFATKFSSMLPAAFLPVVVFLHVLTGGRMGPVPKDPNEDSLLGRLRQSVGPLLRILCIALVVIVPFYFFQGFHSWAFGLRTQMNQQGSDKCLFLFDKLSYRGWWYYFPLAFLIKTPIGTLILIAASLLAFRAGKPLGKKECIFLTLPVALYFLALTRLSLQTGVRYVLPVYPFLFVLAGRLATVSPRSIVVPILIVVAVASTALSDLRSAPYQLAYFNEAVGGPDQGYRCLSDSNVDWGQALYDLKDYIDTNHLPGVYLSYFGTALPEALGIQYQPLAYFGRLSPLPDFEVPADSKPQILAISVSNLQGVPWKDPTMFWWLYDRKPIAKLGNSIFLYDITRDADAHIRLARLYHDARFGSNEYAKGELEKVLAIEPKNAEALAKGELEKALAIEPKNAEALRLKKEWNY